MISEGRVSETELKEFLLEVQKMFLDHDIEALQTRFVLPLVVYSAAGVLVLKDADGFLDHAERYLQALLAQDVAMSECVIKDIDPLNNRRFRTTVRWTDMRESGQPVTRSLVRYFLIAESDGCWKIEMLEFLELPIPVSQAERIIH